MSPMPLPIDLGALMRLAGTDDRASFAGVYDATVGRSYNIALEVVRDPDQAFAAIVEAYRELWDRARTFKDSGERAESWVMATVHRIAVEHARDGEQAAIHVRPASAPVSEPPAAKRRWPTGARLTPVERDVVELAYFRGYTHLEIDGLLQVRLGSSKRSLRTALRELHRVNLLARPTGTD